LKIRITGLKIKR